MKTFGILLLAAVVVMADSKKANAKKMDSAMAKMKAAVSGAVSGAQRADVKAVGPSASLGSSRSAVKAGASVSASANSG